MRHPLIISSLLVLAFAPIGSPPAHADGPEPRTPPTHGGLVVLDAAGQAWEAGRGRAARARVHGERAAAGRAGGALEALSFEAQPELTDGHSEVAGAVILELRPGLGGSRARAASARITAAEAALASDRFAFERAAIQRWVAVVAATLVVTHLEGHLAAVEADLAPLRAAAERHLTTELTLDGLEVERLRLASELDDAVVERARRQRELTTWLGHELAATDEPAATPHDAPPAARWSEVLTRLAQHPELVELEAAAAALRAEATVLGREDGPLVGLGATLRHQAGPSESLLWGGVDVSLRLPLSRPLASEAERRRAEALATTLVAESRRAILEREITARAATHDALTTRLGRLRAETLPRLEQRVERTRGALQAGRASLEALVLARRDALAMHHDETRIVSELLASALESEAMWRQLGRETTGGERR